jgi:hypothetical protein
MERSESTRARSSRRCDGPNAIDGQAQRAIEQARGLLERAAVQTDERLKLGAHRRVAASAASGCRESLDSLCEFITSRQSQPAPLAVKEVVAELRVALLFGLPGTVLGMLVAFADLFAQILKHPDTTPGNSPTLLSVASSTESIHQSCSAQTYVLRPTPEASHRMLAPNPSADADQCSGGFSLAIPKSR